MRAGEIVGVAGLEGQGQLDLFLALVRRTTVDRPPGRSRASRCAHAARRRRCATGSASSRTTAALALCLPLSIRDNIGLGALDRVTRFGLIDRSRESAIVDDAMRTLRVRAKSSRQAVETLSGGNQQKVLLARVLARKPRLLLMYDATRGVDIGTRSEIFELMRGQAADGVAILYYSTDVSELVTLCDRVVVHARRHAARRAERRRAQQGADHRRGDRRSPHMTEHPGNGAGCRGGDGLTLRIDRDVRHVGDARTCTASCSALGDLRS